MRNIMSSLLCMLIGAVGSWAEAGEPNPQSVVDNVVFQLSSTTGRRHRLLSTVHGVKPQRSLRVG